MSPPSQQTRTLSLPSAISDGTMLTIHPTSSPTASSFGGETLRSRSGSFPSIDPSFRTRSNSAQTIVGSSMFQDPPEDALRPDRGTEKDFEVSNNPFAFSPGQLNKLLNPKSLAAFKALGGLRGLEKGLRTSITAGLSVDEARLDGSISFGDATNLDKGNVLDDIPLGRRKSGDVVFQQDGQFQDRLRVFRDNRLPKRKGDSIFVLIWRTYNDKILVLLTIAAVVSLSLGLYQTFSGGSSVDWVEGVAICVAIIIVVFVGALNDYQKEKQFIKLNKRKDDREVKAIRSGKSMQISVYDVTAGDVLHLEPGDAIPADGVLISGHGIRCDESSATGESDQMKKTDGGEAWRQVMDGSASKKLDPFIISGSKVLEGVGTYLVTSVGQNSSYGKILMSLQTESESTPLQVKLGHLANWIGGLGSGAAGLLFFILLIRFIVNLSGNDASPAAKSQQFLDILIVAITVIVVAVPEGLPLAVTLALAFATVRMLKENNLVRVLRACETMGNATTICSDKTGTLTQNKMTVVAGALGVEEKFAKPSTLAKQAEHTASFADVFAKLSKEAQDLLRHSIAINSTAFEGEEKGIGTFIGSKTETALLELARAHLALDNLASERANADIAQLIPFDSSRKCMGVVLRMEAGSYRLLVKGAAELMLDRATLTVVDVFDEDLAIQEMDEESKTKAATTIDEFAQQSLRTIGFLYKDFEQWPPMSVQTLDGDESQADFDHLFHDMIWIGVVGIHDPLREGVVESVAQCQRSGIVVRMVTGDNVATARAIAVECGIMTEGAMVMEGPAFRQLSDEEMNKTLPKLRVLARSSPEDKRILVHRLKQLGETVAVTGDGTNDGPALRMADVGFSMGIAGTEVAKEASSIILLDDNFSSIITAISWGRSVNDAVKKFLQFQITVNITAVTLTFISAVSNNSNDSVLTAVQLLWVNLIMDTLAALALATDAPTNKILQRPPEPKSAPLITVNMWKMIMGQAVYQLIVTFVLYFGGNKIFGSSVTQKELDTMVFNTFVWMQIFNELNNRRLDNKFNIFEGVHRNYWFIGINCVMVGGQIMIIFVGGAAFGITKINGWQWAVCLLCALPCLLWAVLLRCVPDAYFGIVFYGLIDAIKVVLAPVSTIIHVAFLPVMKASRAVKAPTKRIFKRMVAKVRGKKTGNPEEEAAHVDEEATVSSPMSPMTNLPPITLTAPG
jgi:Ca2+-transporting ATPase